MHISRGGKEFRPGDRNSAEKSRGEMSMSQAQFYRQTGVAMTCRSFEEYERMFALDSAALPGKSVLDAAAGASSFVAEARRSGCFAKAADPLYRFTPEQIQARGAKEIEASSAKLAQLTHLYRWDYYGSLEQHRQGRERSLKLFLEDYRLDIDKNAYVPAALPELPFADGTFDIVLCSHFLFLYEEQFDYAFHRRAVEELLRVCRKGGEVRLYPLVNFKTQPYTHMSQLLDDLSLQGYKAELVPSQLPFLPNSERLLKICK
jgi:SAM-dependent methyltransferase